MERIEHLCVRLFWATLPMGGKDSEEMKAEHVVFSPSASLCMTMNGFSRRGLSPTRPLLGDDTFVCVVPPLLAAFPPPFFDNK